MVFVCAAFFFFWVFILLFSFCFGKDGRLPIIKSYLKISSVLNRNRISIRKRDVSFLFLLLKIALFDLSSLKSLLYHQFWTLNWAGYDYAFLNQYACCRVGGGYFENGVSVEPFDKYDFHNYFCNKQDKSPVYILLVYFNR